MDAAKSLFPANLISADVGLPRGYVIRPLRRSDFSRGHLNPLRDLAYIGEITEELWAERFDYMAARHDTYYVVVIVKDDSIVGTGTLVVEKKFLFQLGTQGHIEDVAISKDHQGKRLGVSLIEALDHIAEQVGCYKTILDCNPEKEGFYVKCGYQKAGSEMHHYHSAEAEKYHV